MSNRFPHVPHIFFGEAGLNLQGFKWKKVIEQGGQKIVGTKRSNSRENVTVVAAINAAGEVMPPLILFKGQILQKDWISKYVGVSGAISDS